MFDTWLLLNNLLYKLSHTPHSMSASLSGLIHSFCFDVFAFNSIKILNYKVSGFTTETLTFRKNDVFCLLVMPIGKSSNLFIFLYYFSHRVPRVFKATRIHGSCGPKMIFYWPLALIRWESVKPTCYTWYSVCHCKNYRISASLYSKMYKTYTKNTRHRRQEIVLFMHLKKYIYYSKIPNHTRGNGDWHDQNYSNCVQ